MSPGELIMVMLTTSDIMKESFWIKAKGAIRTIIIIIIIIIIMDTGIGLDESSRYG